MSTRPARKGTGVRGHLVMQTRLVPFARSAPRRLREGRPSHFPDVVLADQLKHRGLVAGPRQPIQRPSWCRRNRPSTPVHQELANPETPNSARQRVRCNCPKHSADSTYRPQIWRHFWRRRKSKLLAGASKALRLGANMLRAVTWVRAARLSQIVLWTRCLPGLEAPSKLLRAVSLARGVCDILVGSIQFGAGSWAGVAA